MNKKEILESIKQIAKENGGKAPGVRQFASLTGVKQGQWCGKYWAKWNDALAEAGVAPNEKTFSYTDEQLLAKYALLVKKLGQVPTLAEMRLHSRGDPEFPADRTFRRFGDKKHLLGAVLEFCEKNSDFQNLVPLIEIEPHVRPSEASEKPAESTPESTGYVYLIKFGNEYKIGTSNNVERRFSQLKTQMPYEGKIIHTIITGDPEGIEAYWHSYYSEKRLRGEWFSLTPADVKYFKKRKLM